MRIVEHYSHMNGLEYLLVHKPQLWDEVKAVVDSVNANEYRIKVSQERTKAGNVLFSPGHLNKAFATAFQKCGWEAETTRYWVTDDVHLIRKTISMSPSEQKQEIEAAGKRPILSYNQTDFVKDRVAVEVQFGNIRLWPTTCS